MSLLIIRRFGVYSTVYLPRLSNFESLANISVAVAFNHKGILG